MLNSFFLTCTQLVGCNYSGVYFRTWFVLGVVTIILLGHVKPSRHLDVQVLQRAADLTQGFGADMRVDLGGFARTVP